MPAATLRRISMKALAKYQVILLGEQRHIRCEQLAQGCCPNSAAVEPATSRSRVQRSNHYTTEPPNCNCKYAFDISWSTSCNKLVSSFRSSVV